MVVAIIGLLAGIVAPRYFGQLGKSEAAAARAQLDALEKALDQYRLDTGRYPSTELGLNALVTRPQSEPKWAGPYLKKAVPADPWGRPYRFERHDGGVKLFTWGADGREGGRGRNADDAYWIITCESASAPATCLRATPR